MVDKNIFKQNMNKRLQEIDSMVDSIMPNDVINSLKKKYKKDLVDYIYIETVDEFSTLKLTGSMRYINKFDQQLRMGGLLIKIYCKEGKWYAILKNSHNKVHVSFHSNHIFYVDTRKELFRDWANCFVTDLEKGIYEVE